MSSVKVAVRVRPYNDREKKQNATSIINMDGKSLTTIKNPVTYSIKNLIISLIQENGEIKEFAFDYSYWSHDGFVEETHPGAYLKALPGSRYADQDKVFKDLGTEVLDNAFEGFNACLFAYG